jgi:hypothetical protein
MDLTIIFRPKELSGAFGFEVIRNQNPVLPIMFRGMIQNSIFGNHKWLLLLIFFSCLQFFLADFTRPFIIANSPSGYREAAEADHKRL